MFYNMYQQIHIVPIGNSMKTLIVALRETRYIFFLYTKQCDDISDDFLSKIIKNIKS